MKGLLRVHNLLFHKALHLHALYVYSMFPMLNFHIIGACVRVRCTLQKSTMVQRQLNIEDRGRAIAWLQGGNTQRNVAVRLGVTQCRWPTLATVPSNVFCSKSSMFGKTPKHYKQRGPLHHQYDSTSTHNHCTPIT